MKKKGVTLIELICVLAIMTIVLGVIYSVFVSGNNIYNKGSNEVEVQDSARSIFLSVGENIKKASYATVSKITLASVNSVKVSNSSGTEITFSNVSNIASSPFRAIYVEIDSAKAYLYIVKSVNGRKELHRIDYTSQASSVVLSDFEDIVFSEKDNLFTLDFSKKDKYNNLRKYSTSISIRNRK
jgi:prepilin-type N-terminal cleavage/methylation domain-containing protein